MTHFSEHTPLKPRYTFTSCSISNAFIPESRSLLPTTYYLLLPQNEEFINIYCTQWYMYRKRQYPEVHLIPEGDHNGANH